VPRVRRAGRRTDALPYAATVAIGSRICRSSQVIRTLGMVPLINVGRLQLAQYEDIKRVLRSNRVAFVESRHEQLPTYLCVKAGDYERANRLVQDEYRDFALAERVKWKHEWDEVHRRSYWRWLLHQWRRKTTLAISGVIWLIT
jgi:hypothetical protein